MDRELQLKALEEFRDFVIQNAKQNLAIKTASGKLKDSLKATVKVMPNSMTFMFEMEEYGWYRDWETVDSSNGVIEPLYRDWETDRKSVV